MAYNTNDKTGIDIVIARYLTDNATHDEIDTLLRWIQQSEENRKYFFEQQDIWENLHPSFRLKDIDTEKAERRLLFRTGIASRGSVVLRKILMLWSRFAAVALLPLLAILLYFTLRPGESSPRYDDVTLYTAYGCTSMATLPDSTVVWLNANSTLRYSPNMDGDSRNVDLRGEAYFDVQADAAHPFNVHTPYITVTATGTEFNVNAYDSDASVTLAEGKVNVEADGKEQLLLPGEHLSVRDGRTSISNNIDLDKYCAWRDGILIFDDDPLTDICRRLQQIYDVEFDIAPELNRQTFHMILKGENISEIIHLFELSAPVKCIAEDKSAERTKSHQKIHIIPS